jgi:uncharacterized protein YukE
MLAPAVIRVESGTEIADLGDQILLRQLEMEHAKLLADYGIEHLDIEQVMTTHRAVTQAISRSLYENGACGIRYYSHLDMQPCFAVFEGRTELEAAGDFEPLTDDIPELLQVASDYHIVLQRVEMNLVDVAEAEVQLGALRDRHSRWREEIQTAHRQVLEVRERVERYGMTLRSILERVGSELEDIRRTAEEADPAQTAQVKSAQILEKLQRATEAIQRLQSEAESTPRFQRERHRLNEEARELEQALTRYQVRIQEGRFPPHIEAESRLLLKDVRSWWPSMPSES